MAQLKSTTISGNLVVTGNINCKGNYWADGSINGNGWYNGYNIKTINDCTEAIYKYGLTTSPHILLIKILIILLFLVFVM